MDTRRLVHLTRSLWMRQSRRTLAGVLGLGAFALPGLAGAGKKRKKRNKRKIKIKRNGFGCVNVGSVCKRGGQCCSGICTGQKGKKRCQSHDTGGCQAGQDDCVAQTSCPENPDPVARCYRTTGNASVCGIGTAGACMACTRDVDCEAGFGPGAACVVCASCPGQMDTACMPTAL